MKLLIYRNEKEYKDYKEQVGEILPFRFKETADSLEIDSNLIIDITDAVWYISANKFDLLSFMRNFIEATDNTTIIANEIVLENINKYLYAYFDEIKYIFEEDKYGAITTKNISQLIRKTAYFYTSDEHFEKIQCYALHKNMLYIGFSQINSNEDKFNCVNKETEFFLDIDSLLYVIENNKALIYLVEQLFQCYPNAVIIFSHDNIDRIRRYFSLYFNDTAIIDEKFPECKITNPHTQGDKKYLIADMTNDEIKKFIDEFNEKLAGHHSFKKNLEVAIKNFIVLNKVGKRKVLSFFLFGESGVGKTETARIIQENLYADTSLVKINFGNYSSKDSLNNLIGSPLGYIGCQDGELGKKIGKSKAGIILFDEIEKADTNVINFFLELLEDGCYTDTLAREYDLNGYIIIFSSNIKTSSDFLNKLPKEFQSRLNVICNFTPISSADKKTYIENTIENAICEIRKNEQYEDLHIENLAKQAIAKKAFLLSDNLREVKQFIFDNIVAVINENKA